MGNEAAFDIKVNVHGGGESGQAGAVKHGISQALQLHQPHLRAALKAAGFTNVSNLAGGILAWADKIDPTMAKY